MAKVLKVTKADKTVHVVPIENKAVYLHMNHRILPQGSQMKLEEIDEKDAVNLPYFDKTYVTGIEAQAKVTDMQKEIETLKAQLALSQIRVPEKAEEVIALISNAKTIDEVNILLNSDTRVTVQQAAAKRISELTTTN